MPPCKGMFSRKSCKAWKWIVVAVSCPLLQKERQEVDTATLPQDEVLSCLHLLCGRTFCLLSQRVHTFKFFWHKITFFILHFGGYYTGHSTICCVFLS